MSDTMTAAVLYGQEDVRVEQVPVPQAGPGEVLVRVGAALTCGTDLKVWRRGYHARMIVPPAVFGHEFAGEVAAAGEGVEGFPVGTRVVAANSAPCGECFYCRRGAETVCEDLLFMNGAYAEYVVVPARIVQKNLLVVPEHLPFQHAALVEPLACVSRGVEETGVQAGETVAIVGAGPIGSLFIQVAKGCGARVIAVDRRKDRLDSALSLGADEAVDASAGDAVAAVKALTEGERGTDRVIECVGLPEVWEFALQLVRKAGTVQLFGGPPAGTAARVDTNHLHYGEVTIKSSFHHTPRHVRRALELIATGTVNANLMIAGEEPLRQLPEVFRRLAAGEPGLKIAIVP